MKWGRVLLLLLAAGYLTGGWFARKTTRSSPQAPSLRWHKSAGDIPSAPSSAALREEDEESSPFLLDERVLRSRRTSTATCSLSFKHESRLGHNNEYFDLGTEIILLDGDSVVIVTRDNQGTTASFTADGVELEQDDVWAWSQETCTAVLPSTVENHFYALYVEGGYTAVYGLLYNPTFQYPLVGLTPTAPNVSPQIEEVSRAEISSLNVVAYTTTSGGVRRAYFESDATNIAGFATYPGFEEDGVYNSTALAFSPNGDVLYLATSVDTLLAVDSDGSSSTHAIKYSGSGKDLCDIAVSPDGLSVYIVSQGTKELVHVQLSSPSKSSTASEAVTYSTGTSFDPFIVKATTDVVVVAMESSDELLMFARDTSTGRLSAGVSANVGTYTSSVQGVVAGFVLSEINSQVVLAMSNNDGGETGGVVVLDIECTTPAPVAESLQPAPSPSTTDACSLQFEQSVSVTSGLEPGNQMVVAEDESWVISVDSTGTELMGWGGSGSGGSYSFVSMSQLSETRALRGLMMRPGSQDIYLFTNNGGEDDLFISEFSEATPYYEPLGQSTATQITGSDGQEDVVLASARSITQPVVSYIGCYADTADDRALEKETQSTEMATQECKEICSDLNSKYFATQNGQECHCGDENSDIDRHGEAVNCDTSCGGDPDDICGGSFASSVYQFDDASVIALVGESGGIRRATVDKATGIFGTTSAFPHLEKNSKMYDARAAAFSPDGLTLYVSTSSQRVLAINSDGTEIPTWSTAAADDDLCNIVVSPDGLSVYVLGCATSVVFHFQLDEPDGGVVSSSIYSADSGVSGSTSGGILIAQALDLSVVIGRSDSDEMVVFQRDAATGILSSATTVQLTSMSETVNGAIVGLFLSSNNIGNKLYVSLASRTTGDDGGLMVLDVMCGLPTPAPTLAPDPCSAYGGIPDPGNVVCCHSDCNTCEDSTNHFQNGKVCSRSQMMSAYNYGTCGVDGTVAPCELPPDPTPAPSAPPSPAPVGPVTVPPTPAPSLAPTLSPTLVPTTSPTTPSSRPELEEARIAAAVIGVDLTFGRGRTSSGLWCYGASCLGSTCDVEDLLDGETVASLGSAPSCSWKDKYTLTIIFGQGYSIGEGSTVTVNALGGYLSGCIDCTEYATGSAVVQPRTLPPELSSAQFSNTGQQIAVQFGGSASSQEIDGSYALVPCEDVFSATSSATLGTGCSVRFTSSSILTIQLGFAYTIRSSSGSTCADDDGTSVSLLDGIARTEIGAFLSTAAGCVAVGGASEPDPPVVEISAPEVVGCCDDLILEGIASYPSTDAALSWTVELADGDQAFDLTDARTVLEEAGASNGLFVTLPSASLDEGSSYTFSLKVTTAFGAMNEAYIEVFKSSDTVPALKIAGSAFRQLWRGLQLIIRTEVSSPRAQDDNATYTWTVASEDSVIDDFPAIVLTTGRNPSVLTLPPYSLGYAGSRYVFRVDLAGGTGGAAMATATVDVVSGALTAYILGGTARNLGISQALYLNASESVDDDQLDNMLEFKWNCTDDVGAECKSPRNAILDMDSFATGGLLTIPAGTLPSGIRYNFGVTAFKGSLGVSDWSELRSDRTACTVSTFEGALPHVTISPKTILRKYNPSERIVLYGCATSSAEEACTSSTSSLFELEWGQANGNLDLRDGWGGAFSTAVNSRTLVARQGILGAGQSYTFSLSASDTSGLVGYAEFSFATNAPPAGGHVASEILSVTAAADVVLLQSLGWTDDVDDLPLTHSFGFVYGYQNTFSVASDSTLLSQLSSSWSTSPTLSTNVPPGLAPDAYNLTIVVSVSDSLGSIAATNLGVDGTPMVITSVPPQEAAALSLAYELSCFPGEACGTGYLTYPEDTLRDARVAATLLREVPQASATDAEAVVALQANIVGLIVDAYLSLEASSSSILSGSQALADALVAVNDNGPPADEVLAEASRAVADMAATVTEHGARLDEASAESLVSIVSVLFDGASGSPTIPSSSTTDASSTALAEKGSYISVLRDVGHAMAFGAEAGEELGQLSVGSLVVQPARVDAIDLPATTVPVGDNGTRISFSAWKQPSDQELGDMRIFSVAVFGPTSSGLEGVTVVDAWDSAGVREERFVEPIGISMVLADSESIDVELETEGLMGHLGCAYWSEDGNDWRTDGLVLGAIGTELDGNAAFVECDTFHLSAFESRQDSTTPQWSTADLLTDFSAFREYGAESWACLLFLGCVGGFLLVPAAWLAWKDADEGRRREYIEALRSTYLARGRGRREIRPLEKRVKDRERTSRQRLVGSGFRQNDQVGVEQPPVRQEIKRMDTVVVQSVLFNHSWRHLTGSPILHFKNTLLTRSQHLLLLLADWMSAIMLQAVFYGKSQFGVRQKVEMTVVSALFMLPPGIIFPALLRAANTPPASKTLERAEDLVHDTVEDETPYGQQTTEPEVHLVLKRGKPTRRATNLPDRHRKKLSSSRMFGALPKQSAEASLFHLPSPTVTVGETAAYVDVVEMQKMLLLVYLPLPVLLAMLVSEVLRVARQAEAAGGDEYAFLPNMVTSLSLACSVLCLLSAFAVVSRNARVMVQTTAFQAVVAPSLALCGVLSYGSSVSIATGAVLGAGMALVGSYLVGVQRKYEAILNEIIEGDLVVAWSNPTQKSHKAAETIQCCFRMHRASQRMTRALEFDSWLHECRSQRRWMQIIAGGAVVTTILCLTYTNMVFALKFDRATSADWLTTCVLALLVDALIQQPAALLATAVLGDFVEEGAILLMDLLL